MKAKCITEHVGVKVAYCEPECYFLLEYAGLYFCTVHGVSTDLWVYLNRIAFIENGESMSMCQSKCPLLKDIDTINVVQQLKTIRFFEKLHSDYFGESEIIEGEIE